jgi:hypothetical protein
VTQLAAPRLADLRWLLQQAGVRSVSAPDYFASPLQVRAQGAPLVRTRPPYPDGLRMRWGRGAAWRVRGVAGRHGRQRPARGPLPAGGSGARPPARRGRCVAGGAGDYGPPVPACAHGVMAARWWPLSLSASLPTPPRTRPSRRVTARARAPAATHASTATRTPTTTRTACTARAVGVRRGPRPARPSVTQPAPSAAARRGPRQPGACAERLLALMAST